MVNKKTRRRFGELDFLRGLSLLAMIIWHLLWDLQVYYGFPFRYDQGWMYWTGKAIAISFMALAGIGSYFTSNHGKRAIRILLYAMLITGVTFFYDRQQMIWFGILHFMALNMLLYPWYRNWHPLLLIGLAVGVFSLGPLVSQVDMPTNIFLPLGFRSFDYRSLDYFPLFPYGGYFIIGAILGPIIYPKRKARIVFDIPSNPISFLGKHPLTVYLLHQPILLGLLQLLALAGLLGN